MAHLDSLPIRLLPACYRSAYDAPLGRVLQLQRPQGVISVAFRCRYEVANGYAESIVFLEGEDAGFLGEPSELSVPAMDVSDYLDICVLNPAPKILIAVKQDVRHLFQHTVDNSIILYAMTKNRGTMWIVLSHPDQTKIGTGTYNVDIANLLHLGLVWVKAKPTLYQQIGNILSNPDVLGDPNILKS